MGGIVGFQIVHPLHLDDEAHGGFIPRSLCGDEFLQMFDSPLGGSIGESNDPVMLQGYPLDLHKPPLFRVLPVEIKSRITKRSLSAQDFQVRTEVPLLHPLPEDVVGRLGIHVDQQRLLPPHLLHRHQIEAGLALGIAALHQPDRRPRNEQLPAAAGAFLGFVFGGAVLISGDAAAFLAVNPIATVCVVLLKGMLCGLISGLVYLGFEKINRFISVIAAAIICPIVNTGVFLIGCKLFFMPTITEWAIGLGFKDAGSYMIFGLVGINFLIELGVNIILSPVIVRIINYRKK